MKTEEIFKEAGMVREGHFLLTSGLHSGLYFEKFRLLERPELTSEVCRQLANAFRDREVETVAGPTTGGIIIAYEVARQLQTRCIFAERTQEGRDFLRGFEIRPGERVLVVDDVLTTGGSIRDTLEALEKRDGEVVGIGVLVDRRQEDTDLGYPIFSVFKQAVKNYNPADCPLCKQKIPLTKPGASKG